MKTHPTMPGGIAFRYSNGSLRVREIATTTLIKQFHNNEHVGACTGNDPLEWQITWLQGL